jgi:hypothetical protein
MGEPYEFSRIFRFRIGEAEEDVVPAFVIDGRDYTDIEKLRNDLRAARDALDQMHLINDRETLSGGPDAPRAIQPSWAQWREQHIVLAEPTGIRPATEPWTEPLGWIEMDLWLTESHSFLQYHLTRAAGAGAGSLISLLSDRGPARVGRASSVAPGDERYRVDSVVLVVPQAIPQALKALTRELSAAGWDVGEPVTGTDATVISATSKGHRIDAVWAHNETAFMLLGKSPVVSATDFAAP